MVIIYVFIPRAEHSVFFRMPSVVRYLPVWFFPVLLSQLIQPLQDIPAARLILSTVPR